MDSAYQKLTEIWHQCPIQGNSALMNIIDLLRDYNIALRQKEGKLVQINLSIPESVEGAYVVGLRYIKIDGTFSEDHFLCEKHAQKISQK